MSLRQTLSWLICALLAAGLIGGCGATGSADPGTGTTPLGMGYHPPAPKLTNVAADSIAVVDLTNTGSVRPAGLNFASDGTLRTVRWSSWGGRSAEGRGTAALRLCGSSCADTHMVDYPATVRLTEVVTCSHRRYYNRAAVTISTDTGPRRWGSFIHAPCTAPPMVYR
jgi:hypothetical protein